MCMYCERRKDIKFGWKQPKLPYHNQKDISANLNGNVLENEKWDGVIHDYQTACPELILTCPGYFNGDGVGTIHIPIKCCPECGRKLGSDGQTENTRPAVDYKLEAYDKDSDTYIKILSSADIEMLKTLGINLWQKFDITSESNNEPIDWLVISTNDDNQTPVCHLSGIQKYAEWHYYEE